MFRKQDRAMPDPEDTFFAPRSGEFSLYRRGRNNETGQVTDLLQPAKDLPRPSFSGIITKKGHLVKGYHIKTIFETLR